MEASEIRARARANLANTWVLSIGVAAVAALLGGVMAGSSFLPEVREYREIITQGGAVSWRVGFTGGLLGLASFLLGGVLELGYARFLLKQHDRQSLDFADLFSQFDRYGTGFAQAFLRSLYTFLWSLLLIVPGIIAALGYSMTPFILAENPDMTAGEAIRAAKELMQGHKMDLFILRLTFLGWEILAVLTMNLGFLALNPYMNAATTVFYRNISGQRRYRGYEQVEY